MYVEIKPIFHKYLTKIDPVTGNMFSPEWELPKYATEGAAGIDFRAAIDERIDLWPGETRKIPTGVAIHIHNKNLALFLAPRSGLGCNNNIVLGNSIGIVDSDYQGEIILCVKNNSLPEHGELFFIEPGMKLAQGIFVRVEQVTFLAVEDFDKITERGAGGFGSTGT